VGENIIFKPSANWKAAAKEDAKDKGSMKDQLKDKKVKCRICNAEHFTARCPFKDTMAPMGEEGTGVGGLDAGSGRNTPEPSGALGQGGSSYVPPHLRKGGAAAGGDRMGGKYGERDEMATLRVTNVSEFAEEQELRDMFERWGRVTRVFLAKDRETGRAKGFAFVSYAERGDAARACEKMDGCKFLSCVLFVVEWS
jgi:translation initiation factor 3 subunit G